MSARRMRAVVERGDLLEAEPDATPAPWWSLAKTALAAAALALVERGRLELDAPFRGGPWTLRHLLQHTSGLPDYGGSPDYHRAVARGDTPWSRESLLERIDARHARSVPGERFEYSNVGYLMVRDAIETTFDGDLQAALRGLVFRPLGLDAVRVAREPADLVDIGAPTPPGYHPGWVYHGLVLGTPADAALFVDRLLGGGLLGEAMLTAMRTPFPIGDAAMPDRPWRSPGYGLGLMIETGRPDGRWTGHTGGGPGSITATYACERDGRRRVAAVFGLTGDVGPVEHEAFDAARGGSERPPALSAAAR